MEISTSDTYETPGPTPSDVEALKGPVVLEFGVSWCAHCRAAQPLLTAALSNRPHVRHVKVEDGRGRPLGRTFHVTLWPTFVFLNYGKEVARLVRPVDPGEIDRALNQIDSVSL